MPELPEVESIRRSVSPFIVGKRVLGATLQRRDILVAPGDPSGGFARQRKTGGIRPKRLLAGDLLERAMVIDVLRRGKQLVIVAQPGKTRAERERIGLGVQLGMSGSLTFSPKQPTPKELGTHAHALWRFEHGTLVFDDPRRFGGLRVFRSMEELVEHWKGLGPDALGITTQELKGGLGVGGKGGKRAIKAALLDQSVLAGVGNIYADESLFTSRIAPTRLTSTLSDPEVTALVDAIRTTLKHAIAANGSTLRNYTNARGEPGVYQASHAVYGRSGQTCQRCGGPLKSALIAQRTTVWCPRCQH